jgi:hypothetical protein
VFEPGLPLLHDAQHLAVAVQLDTPWLDRKLAALQAHTSQTAPLIDAVGLDRYRRYVSTECLIDSAAY